MSTNIFKKPVVYLFRAEVKTIIQVPPPPSPPPPPPPVLLLLLLL